VTDAGRRRYFDWIDAILFAVGFVLMIVALATIDLGTLRLVAFLLVALPIALRRKLFGPPEQPAPRAGAAWSLLSVLGLLGVIVGTMTLAIGADAMVDRVAYGETLSSTVEVVVAGAVMVLFGALLLRARYPRVQPVIPPAQLRE
jgi:drug/metabolite transporter (DMT)-like permease